MAEFNANYGNFDLASLYDSLSDSDNEYLATIDLGDLLINSLENNIVKFEETSKSETEVHEQDNECVQNENESNYEPQQKRFKCLTEVDIDSLETKHQSTATKKNTQWGIKLFQEWHQEVYGGNLDLETVGKEDLAEKLRKFYFEATPKPNEKREQSLPEHQRNEYHRNTLVNIRSAINRYLKDICRNIDIVRDIEFVRSNRTLDGFLKSRTEAGLSRPTQHKEILTKEDLEKTATYLQKYENSPVILREAAWYVIAVHFVTRGMEFHHQLRKNSLDFKGDSDSQYIVLNQEIKQKNHQGAASSTNLMSEKRIYATGECLCPVKILKLFVEKQSPNATMLFNQFDNNAILHPESSNTWYTEKPLAKRSFVNFMKNISTSAKLSQRYTGHCMRATAIQAMNDAGYEARHIMFMSGHRNEASIRSYNRGCNNTQKKSMSNTLSALTEPTCKSAKQLVKCQSATSSSEQSMRPVLEMQIQGLHNRDEMSASSQLVQSNEQNICSLELFRGATLSNCTINITKPH